MHEKDKDKGKTWITASFSTCTKVIFTIAATVHHASVRVTLCSHVQVLF
jgi:hypothetical protein